MVATTTNATSISDRWAWKQRNIELDILSETNTLTSSPRIPVTRETLSSCWAPTITGVVPSEIHAELLQAGLISDPYIAFGEHQAQWIADEEWLWGCIFSLPKPPNPVAQVKRAVITFEGLDTICDVYLNGEKILTTDNMFRGYQYEIPFAADGSLKLKADNTLLLHFTSARALAKALEADYGKVRAGSTNLGDPSRVYIRKAQYGWRWDWGPEIMTCGPYRPITLATTYHPIRIEDVWAKGWLTASHVGDVTSYIPSLGVDISLSHLPNLDQGYSLEISLVDAGETVKVGKLVVPTASDVAETQSVLRLDWPDLRPENVQAWWPTGMGQQKLYQLEVRLLAPGDGDDRLVESRLKRIGFRSARLVQDDLQEADQYGTGTTFFFEINGEKMFVGGSNWIPADNLLTTLSEKRYRDWLTLVRDGNQAMVRIWGGGIYEPDLFYDICDELGLLVWQDFQFACGVYPGVSSPEASSLAPKSYPAFVENVKREAECNVKRLRNHPSIVVWCGNNEDYQMVLQWGDVPHLPATILYEEVLPSVITSLTSFQISSRSGIRTVQAPYVRGSPYGGKGWDTADPTVGDVHQWNIWGGKELPYQDYGKWGGRFVSEFGIPSFPSSKTVEYWMQGVDAREWYAQSRAMAQHIRAGSYERRFAILMNENFRNVAANDFDRYRFNTQVMQSEAVSYAYRVWKREWRGKGKEYCGGVLVWQFNDCWPVASWALVDYFLRPKPVYYSVARQLAPVTVNILRQVVQNRDNDRPKQFYEYGATRSTSATLHVWATNTTLKPIHVKLDLKYFDLESDWTAANDFRGPSASLFVLQPNQSTDLLTVPCPSPDCSRRLRSVVGPGVDGSGTVVASARLLDPRTDDVLARFVDWPQPFRYLHIPRPVACVDVLHVDATTGDAILRIGVEKPVKCLWLEGVAWDGAMARDEATGLGGDLQVVSELDEVGWSDNALDVVPGDPQVVVAKGLGSRKVKTMWLEG